MYAWPGGQAPPPDEDWKLALLGQTDILLQPHRLSPAFIELLLGESILANREALLAAARSAEQGPSETLDEELAKLSFLPSQLYSLALVRQLDMPAEAYLGSPNVLSFHSQVRQDEAGALSVFQSYDIVSNEIAVHPSGRENAVSVRLHQGVRDSNAESLMARAQCDTFSLEGFACEQAANAADRLDQGRNGWVLVANGDDLQALESVPGGLAEALSVGRVAIVHTGEDQVWWQLDPATGSVLAMGENGWGDAAVDYAIAIWANVFGFAFCMAGSGSTIGNAACVVGVFLGGSAAVAALVQAAVATKVLAVLAIILGGLPVVVEAHSD